jgi:protein-tyrosine phosphatase
MSADLSGLGGDVSENFRILVVCLGNVCRSPLAEHLLRQRFQALLGRSGSSVIEVSSAGVRAMVGEPMNEYAQAELRRLEGDPTTFTARQLTTTAANRASLVLTATRDLRSRVLEEAPRALKRTFTLREFAALVRSDMFADRRMDGASDLVNQAFTWRGSVTVENYDIADPIGRSPAFHRNVAETIDTDCEVIARAVVAATLSEVSPR